MNIRKQIILLAMLLGTSFGALAAAARSEAAYPTGDWRFGSPEAEVVSAQGFTPRYADGKLAGLERIAYGGTDYAALESALDAEVATLRRDFGGATFGLDANTQVAVHYDEKIRGALLNILRKSPSMAEEIRSKGGVITVVLEVRPVAQPANANLYLHALYDAKARRYELRILLDGPTDPLREDVTAVNVDMQGKDEKN